MIFRAFRYRLKPTNEQELLFRQFSGVCRLVYNLGFEQRRDFYRQFRAAKGRGISYASQCRELTELRQQFDWIAAVLCTAQNQALRDLDRAFESFFSGKTSYPKPRRKGENESFRFKGSEAQIRNINGKWAEVSVPKIGWVVFRSTRPLTGDMKNITIVEDGGGWHINFACAIEHEAPANISPSVGIDRGITNTLTLSTGERLSVPIGLRAIDRRYRAAQRILARRKRGSRRRARQLRRCASLSARRARIRRDWHHKAALSIAQRFGGVVLEDLKISSMTASAKGTADAPGVNVLAKSGLNRSILNQGWYAFETILAYKLEERGGHLLKCNPAYTSQTCSACGTVDRESRESQASFNCRSCGFRAHADHNAAINILRRNTASKLVERRRKPLSEARTGRVIIHPENPLAVASGGC